MPAQRQLPLPFPREARPAPVDFTLSASNEAAVTWLHRVADWPQGRLALWGPPGCGKTHLLRHWTDTSGAHYLTGPKLPGLDELPELPGTAGLAIDNADEMAEEATLLHLLNAAAEARLPVLLAARTAPARWPVRLRDLASRLRAMTAVEIQPPDDGLLRILLFRLLAARQLSVTETTREWLLNRLPRTQAALSEAVARLDRASLDRVALGESGGITPRLAQAELADLIGADLDAEASDAGPMSGVAEPPAPLRGDRNLNF